MDSGFNLAAPAPPEVKIAAMKRELRRLAARCGYGMPPDDLSAADDETLEDQVRFLRVCFSRYGFVEA